MINKEKTKISYKKIKAYLNQYKQINSEISHPLKEAKLESKMILNYIIEGQSKRNGKNNNC